MVQRTDQWPDDYIGDGVYASFDGYHIILELKGQPDARGHHCRIALEPGVMGALVSYRDTVKKVADKQRTEEADALRTKTR